MLILDLSQPVVCSMTGRMRQEKGWGNQHRHFLRSHLFVFVTNGTATFEIGDKSYRISAGDIILVPANTEYLPNTEDFCEYFFFHFSGNLVQTNVCPHYDYAFRKYSFHLPKVTQREIYLDYCIRCKTDYAKLYDVLLSVHKYKADGTYTSRFMIDTDFLRILLMASAVLETDLYRDAMPGTLQKIISYIEKNLLEPITVSDICEAFKITPSYVARLFKKYLGITPTDYINGRKLEYAIELMKNTSLNITQISDYLGYCDVYYFSKLFKKKYGKSPTKYLE